MATVGPGEMRGSGAFFVSLEDDEPVILSLGTGPGLGRLPQRLSARLQSRRSSQSKESGQSQNNAPSAQKGHAAAEAGHDRVHNDTTSQSSDRLMHLSVRLARAEERRADLLAKMQHKSAERLYKQRAALAQRRRCQEQAQHDHWSKIRERAFIAHFRRECLRSVPKSRLLRDDVTRGTQLVGAATLIISTWIRSKARPPIHAFLATEIMNVARRQDYPRMQEAMMDRHTIKTATDLVLRFVACNAVASSTLNPKRCGRVLLTSLLLDRFASHVMPDACGEELLLLEQAAVLSNSLQDYLAHPTRANQLVLSEAWSVFNDSFTVWQTADLKVLVVGLQSDYIALQNIAVSLGQEARAEWMPHVQRHQQRLRAALKRVAGQRAITDLDAKLAAIAAEATEAVSNDPPAPAAEAKLLTEEEYAAIRRSLHETDGATGPFDNIHIAHEMMVDESFDYRRLLELKTGRPYDARPAVIVDGNLSTFLDFVLLLKSQLMEMSQGKGPLAADLSSNLEEAFLREQLRNNALDPTGLLTFLVDTMGKMCAPARDESMRSLRRLVDTEADLAELCRRTAEMVLLMHEDLANYHLKGVKATLAQHIIPYERDWYARNVLNLPISASEARVRATWQTAKEQLREEKPLAQIHAVIAEVLLGFLGLATDQTAALHGKVEEFELLRLDASRIVRLRQRLQHIALISAMSLALENLCHPTAKATIGRIWTLIEGGATHEAIQAEAVRDIAGSEVGDAIASATGRILTMRDPLVLLLTRRMGTMVREALGKEQFSPRPVAALVRSGLAETVADAYNSIVKETSAMFRLHCSVLAPVYHRLMHPPQ